MSLCCFLFPVISIFHYFFCGFFVMSETALKEMAGTPLKQPETTSGQLCKNLFGFLNCFVKLLIHEIRYKHANIMSM